MELLKSGLKKRVVFWSKTTHMSTPFLQSQRLQSATHFTKNGNFED